MLAGAVCLGFPFLYIVAPAFVAGQDHELGWTVLWICVAIGAMVVLYSLVLSIGSLITARRGEGGRTALAIVAVVFAVLSPFTAAAGIVMSILLMSGGGAHGRPLRDRFGRARVARSAPGVAWSRDLQVRVDHLDQGVRRLLGEAWLEDARLEHASVAAFGRLALDLLALGAPPSLLVRTHQAALEEVEHARLAFSLASAYLSAPVTAGCFPEAASIPAESLDARAERVMFECLVDGDAGEGAAALAAEKALEGAGDPVVGSVLSTIARDEASHAALARDLVSWLRSAPEFPTAARRGAQRAARSLHAVTASLRIGSSSAAPLPGRLSSDTLGRIRAAEAARVLASLEMSAQMATEKASFAPGQIQL